MTNAEIREVKGLNANTPILHHVKKLGQNRFQAQHGGRTIYTKMTERDIFWQIRGNNVQWEDAYMASAID